MEHFIFKFGLGIGIAGLVYLQEYGLAFLLFGIACVAFNVLGALDKVYLARLEKIEDVLWKIHEKK